MLRDSKGMYVLLYGCGKHPYLIGCVTTEVELCINGTIDVLETTMCRFVGGCG